MVSSPGSPASVSRGPVPCTLSARPAEVITIVAGTFFAIPPAPTRAQRASANSGEMGRGAQPSCARRTSSMWMKYSTVFIAPSKGRRRNGGPPRTVSTSFFHGVRFRAACRTLSVYPASGGQTRPGRCPGAVHGQRGAPPGRSDPPLAQCRGVGPKLEKEIAEGVAFLLSKGGRSHSLIVRTRIRQTGPESFRGHQDRHLHQRNGCSSPRKIGDREWSMNVPHLGQQPLGRLRALLRPRGRNQGLHAVEPQFGDPVEVLRCTTSGGESGLRGPGVVCSCTYLRIPRTGGQGEDQRPVDFPPVAMELGFVDIVASGGGRTRASARLEDTETNGPVSAWLRIGPRCLEMEERWPIVRRSQRPDQCRLQEGGKDGPN